MTKNIFGWAIYALKMISLFHSHNAPTLSIMIHISGDTTKQNNVN